MKKMVLALMSFALISTASMASNSTEKILVQEGLNSAIKNVKKIF